MKIKQLPKGPLYWRIENFSTWLAAEVAGKVWLFTLGAKGGKTVGGTLVAEVGPRSSNHRI